MGNLLNNDEFHNQLSDTNLARIEKLLLILYSDKQKIKQVAEIRKIGKANGIPSIKNWNVSQILKNSKGMVAAVDGGWKITLKGTSHLVGKKLITLKKAALQNDVEELQKTLKKIKNNDIKAFIEEAISCLRTDLLRAAVVLSWVGAISILQEYVIKNHLTSFNAEAIRRDAKWKSAVTADDLSKMKEHDFLNILESISVIGKNVKGELQNALTLRNGCGHPNSLKIGVKRVSSHIEILLLNVFTVF